MSLQIVCTTPTVGRNAPCPCGSGKKWKRCHGGPVRLLVPIGSYAAGKPHEKPAFYLYDKFVAPPERPYGVVQR